MAWVAGFAARHGEPSATLVTDEVKLTAADGAEAVIEVPFPPLDPGSPFDKLTERGGLIDALADHLREEHRVGAVLVRKGGYAVGLFDGSRLVESKVGSSYVQGKTKAGGWSQQRYARRRDNQSTKAYADAAHVTARVLAGRDDLEAVFTGGDRPGLAAVLGDPRLQDLAALVKPRVFAVSDPRLRVLQAFPGQFLALQIRLNGLA